MIGAMFGYVASGIVSDFPNMTYSDEQKFVYFEKTKYDFVVFSALVIDTCTQLSF